MAPQIAVNVSLSSLQWSVTRAHGDKLVMVINVVEGKQHPFSESLKDALNLNMPAFIYTSNSAPKTTESLHFTAESNDTFK